MPGSKASSPKNASESKDVKGASDVLAASAAKSEQPDLNQSNINDTSLYAKDSVASGTPTPIKESDLSGLSGASDPLMKTAEDITVEKKESGEKSEFVSDAKIYDSSPEAEGGGSPKTSPKAGGD